MWEQQYEEEPIEKHQCKWMPSIKTLHSVKKVAVRGKWAKVQLTTPTRAKRTNTPQPALIYKTQCDDITNLPLSEPLQNPTAGF